MHSSLENNCSSSSLSLNNEMISFCRIDGYDLPLCSRERSKRYFSMDLTVERSSYIWLGRLTLLSHHFVSSKLRFGAARTTFNNCSTDYIDYLVVMYKSQPNWYCFRLMVTISSGAEYVSTNHSWGVLLRHVLCSSILKWCWWMSVCKRTFHCK